jgi:hypothetical protein
MEKINQAFSYLNSAQITFVATSCPDQGISELGLLPKDHMFCGRVKSTNVSIVTDFSNMNCFTCKMREALSSCFTADGSVNRRGKGNITPSPCGETQICTGYEFFCFVLRVRGAVIQQCADIVTGIFCP